LICLFSFKIKQILPLPPVTAGAFTILRYKYSEFRVSGAFNLCVFFFATKIYNEILLMQEKFTAAIADNGRPNWSAARMLGLSILQEIHNLPDQDALH
jgi:hypothetical protein